MAPRGVCSVCQTVQDIDANPDPEFDPDVHTPSEEYYVMKQHFVYNAWCAGAGINPETIVVEQTFVDEKGRKVT